MRHAPEGNTRDYLRALQLAEADADVALIAHACNNLGYGGYARQGDLARALSYCRKALDHCRQPGADPTMEGHTEDSLGYIYSRLGDQRRALASYQRAVHIFQSTGAPYLSAQSLGNLGDCHQAAGAVQAADRAWQQALAILDELSHPDASEVRRKLAGLRDGSQASG